MLDTLFWVGSYLHLLAIIALLMKVWCTQDCTGISLKTQFLYVLVFTTRYVDLFTTFISRENTFLKIFYILLTFLTVSSITLFLWKSYEKKYDTAKIEILIIPCIVIAVLVNHDSSYMEILWTFSVCLEAVAMVPQFHFIYKSKRIHKHIMCYIAAIATYEGLYIAHWAYQYYYGSHFYDNLRVSAGIIQFILYCDFFVRILICTPKTDIQPTISTVNVDVESGTLPKTGHLSSNVSTIVLTPNFLTGVHSDKANLLAAEDTIEKY